MKVIPKINTRTDLLVCFNVSGGAKFGRVMQSIFCSDSNTAIVYQFVAFHLVALVLLLLGRCSTFRLQVDDLCPRRFTSVPRIALLYWSLIRQLLLVFSFLIHFSLVAASHSVGVDDVHRPLGQWSRPHKSVR